MFWPRYGIMGVYCLSQGHNGALPSSETERRVDNLAIASLRFYSLSCIAINWDDSVKYLSQDHYVFSDVIKLATLRLLFGAVTDWATPPQIYNCNKVFHCKLLIINLCVKLSLNLFIRYWNNVELNHFLFANNIQLFRFATKRWIQFGRRNLLSSYTHLKVPY